MSDPAATYGEWLVQMKNLKGGWLGGLVILLSLAAAIAGGVYGIDLFPAGRYPQIVLALPGIITGAVAFFVISLLFWPLKKPKS